MPANLPALYWRPLLAAETEQPELVALTGSHKPDVSLGITPMPLANGDYLLVLEEPLVEGADYTITDFNSCLGGGNSRSVRFHVGPAAPLPASLGALHLGAALLAGVSVPDDASCSRTITTARRVSIELASMDDIAPWLAALHFETRIDDKPWRPRDGEGSGPPPGESWVGRGVDAVYRGCQTDTTSHEGISAGDHVVTMLATLPGTSISLVSEPATFSISCADLPLDDLSASDGSGCSASGASGVAPWLVVVLGGLASRMRRRRPAAS